MPPSRATVARLTRITREECESFRQNPSLNPLTTRTIDPHGETAEAIRNRCDQLYPVHRNPPNVPRNRVVRHPSLAQQLRNATREQCEAYRRHPNISPVTGQQLTARSAHQWFERCNQLYPLPRQQQPQQRRAHADLPGRPRRPDLSQEDLDQLRPYLDSDEQRRLQTQITEWQRRSRTPSIQKKVHSAPEHLDMSNFDQKCSIFFTNVSSEFNTFVNKLRKICNATRQKCTSENLEQLRQAIAPSYHTKSFTFYVDNTNTLRGIFNNLIVRPGPERQHIVDNIFRSNLDQFQLRFANDQAGVGIGVARTAIQNIVDDIHDLKFFVPAEDGSNRLIINPDMSVAYVRSKGFEVNGSKDLKTLYHFIGQVLAFCVRNDIPTNLNLSYGILSHMLLKHSEIDLDEFVMYYFMEMPTNAHPYIQLLSAADAIEDTYLSFNAEFPLKRNNNENDDVTKHNYKEYLQLRSYYLIGKRNGELLQDLVDGFYIRNRLRRQNATVMQLDRLIGGLAITEQNIRDWVAADRISNPAGTPYSTHIVSWIKEIMLDFGEEFPYDEVPNIGEHNTAKQRKEIFIDFIGRFMHFWTALRKLDQNRVHQVSIIETQGLPKSSTCFYQLKIPQGIRSKDVLYRRIVSAVYNVEAGLGLYGGRKTKKTRKHK